MRYPSTLPFTIGNDICRIARVRRILQGKLSLHFVRRILQQEEGQHPNTWPILRCLFERPPAPGASEVNANADKATAARDAIAFNRAVEFMAGRFAAKEAVIKAHPHHRLTFQSIAILRTSVRADPDFGGVHDFENEADFGAEAGFKGTLDAFEQRERQVEDILARGEAPSRNETATTAASSPTNSTTTTLAQDESEGAEEGKSEGEGESEAKIEERGSPLVAQITTEGKNHFGRRQTYASVSISHDGEYATAVCLGMNPGSPFSKWSSL
ncbi:hypothetical protein F4777DRAFT_48460 [Nemania sp. FL0916]|nr:hypothetical protein F4777DRAFT_48460 [Nemania sp. FL0916]